MLNVGEIYVGEGAFRVNRRHEYYYICICAEDPIFLSLNERKQTLVPATQLVATQYDLPFLQKRYYIDVSVVHVLSAQDVQNLMKVGALPGRLRDQIRANIIQYDYLQTKFRVTIQKNFG